MTVKILRQGLLLLFFFATLLSATAQEIIRVLDAPSGTPLEDVLLLTPEGSLLGISDGHGEVGISDTGTVIIFHLLGYKTVRRDWEELRSTNFEIRLEPGEISLDQVVISATRWFGTTMNIPRKVTSIGKQSFELMLPQTAADLLGTTGEVFVQKSQLGGGSPMIRGFSTNRLLYSIDGVRMNTAIFRSGNLQNVISLDAMAMQSAEVLFGPGAVMYGSDAIGAVMSFTTRNAELSPSEKTHVFGESKFRFSSASNEKTGHIHVNAGGQKWAGLTSLTFSDFGDLTMGSHGPETYLRNFYVSREGEVDVVIENDNPKKQRPSGYSQVNLMQKVRFRPTENLDFQYAFHYSSTSEFGRYDRLNEVSDGEPVSAEWNYGPQRWQMHHLQATLSDKTKMYDQMAARLAFQKFDESRIDRGFNEVDLRERKESVNAYSLNLDFKKNIRKTTINYGLEGVMNDVQSVGESTDIESNTTLPVASRYPDSQWYSYGIFAVANMELTPGLHLETGLRFNYFRLTSDFSYNRQFLPLPFSSAKVNNHALTGNAGLTFHLSKNSTLRFILSTGFRAPNVDDMGKVFDSEPGSVVVPNPELNPEYAYNAETGISRIFGNCVKLDFTLFYTILENAMVRRNFQLNGLDSIDYDGSKSNVQAIQNAARSTVYGVQGGIEIQLPYDLRLASRVNYQKGKDELDDGSVSPSRHAAPLFGQTTLTYQAERWNLVFYVQYSSKRSFDDMPVEERGKPQLYASDNNGNPYSPSWYTLNLKTSYIISNHLSVTGGLENLTDRRYRPYSSGITAPGINAVISARVRF